MSLIVVRMLIVLTLSCTGSYGFEWTSALPDCSVKYACVGDALTIPWSFTVAPGDTIVAVHWFFWAASEQLIAMFTPPHFAPMPAYAHRVQRTSLAGIALINMTTADTGSYYVRITVSKGSGAVHVKYNHTVVVQVMENNKLLTTDGELHAMLEPQAIYSNTKGRWSLVLSCGNFTYLGDPPFNMEWQTPGGVVPSDGYTDGHFQLHVTSGRGGDYTCRTPLHAAADICLHPTSILSNAVHVDAMDARLALIEAKQERLQDENKHLREKDRLLDAENHLLAWDVQSLTNKVSHQVAFTAMLYTKHDSPATVIFGNVITNLGKGYSSTTGMFTAPVAGLYFFTLTSSPETNDDNPRAVMQSEGSTLCFAASNTAMPGKVASCGAAVHLAAGKRVYVTCHSHLTAPYSSFSGFLVNSD